MPQEIEVEGKDVQQAVERGLRQMGLRRDQVEVAIKDEGSSGFLGLGARPARVQIRERRWEGEGQPPSAAPAPSQSSGTLRAPEPRSEPRGEPQRERRGDERRGAGRDTRDRRDERRQGDRRQSGYRRDERRDDRYRQQRPQPAAAEPPRADKPEREAPADPEAAVRESKTVVGELMKLMDLEVKEVRAEWDPDQIRVKSEIDTPDAAALVGKEGRVLEALQFLSTVLVSRRMKTPVAVQVDTGGYWRQREDRILDQVQKAAEEVARTGRAFKLDPMDAATRRLVHKSLSNHPAVETASEGEGPWRKVVLKPKNSGPR